MVQVTLDDWVRDDDDGGSDGSDGDGEDDGDN